MIRTVCMLVWLLASPAVTQYRPLSMGDIVDAVGSNPEGMPTDELGERISTYAYYTSDDRGVGLAVRFSSDPDGAIFAAWRLRGELWRHAWIEDETLGRLETIRPAGRGFVIDTRHADGSGTAAVLRPDLELLAAVPGIPRIALPSGAVIIERTHALVIFDPSFGQTQPFFTSARAESTTFGAFRYDAGTDTLSFDQRVGGSLQTIRCRAVSAPQRKCGQ